ncbi:Stk1 family PASTA domain-containing Ser/Thr kinase [Nocardiopsis ansamitocini]|uniref:non-specific serine/threonine protein kinase n=1 Tax=Nocardiopsis ansamitocini TaxID=1670832 RepID=A0A9W6P2T3_9ACTN|nr:Stk1 family PASTA domain-containing Ser/Thr kinase [Nocardiopsis ansamitocini]GLU46056.1 putative serine/threonine-protein kinase [Nocardiopsis ansamitocini]
MDMTTADALVGTTLDGRYLIQSRVAGGGMATVYAAHDERLDRHVALKVMHPTLARDPQFVQRFINEAHSVAKLSHPNVVQVYDQGTDQGHVYLAMEYVPGRTLRELLKARGRLSPREALQVMVPVLAALGAAHQVGMVHRDIKPENVLLTEDGRVKVVDFGLARVVEATQQGLTKTGALMGTAAYLSPEQISHNTADSRTDVYACGIMLYELLTGAQPHTGENPISVAYQHVNEDVPRPSRVVEGISPSVDALVVRATERDPRYRLTDAGQFLAAVFEVERSLGQTGANVTFAPVMAGAVNEVASGPAEPENQTLVVDLKPGDLPPVEYDDDDYDDHRPPRPSMRYPLMLIGALLLVAGLGFGWWMLAGRYEVVPELVGLDRDTARQELTPLGLKITVSDDTVYSDEAPAGTIAATNPKNGDNILPGEIITVTLSDGPQFVEVPDISGKPINEALQLLEDAGLTDIEQQEASSFDAEPGTVLSSDPSPGEKADREGSVVLSVSTGFAVPEVVGSNVNDARSLLEEKDLKVEITEEHNDDVPKDQVMEQSPGDGEKVGAGDTVTLKVSLGPEMVEIPDIRGWKVDDARKKLEELGFTVKVHRFVGDFVGDYNPKNEADKGSEVEIWVSPFPNGDGDNDNRPGGGRGGGRNNNNDDD